MLLLLFVVTSALCDEAHAQILYKRALAPFDALQHMRYFPQVVSRPYAMQATYPVYALPPQYEAPPEYAPEYEYEAAPYAASYGDYAPPQEAASDSEAYGDLLAGYLMRPDPEPFPAYRRRADNYPTHNSPGNSPTTNTHPPPPTTAPLPPVGVTAVATAAAQKRVSERVVAPPPPPSIRQEEGVAGQKEEPLFRPQHPSQRAALWPPRHTKSSIPLLKQMIQSGQGRRDPLAEELRDAKKKTT